MADAPPPTASAATTPLRVSGMTCQNCARKVTETLRLLPGVRGVTVSLEAERVTVRWADGAARDPAPLLAALARAGYPANVLDAAAADGGAGRSAGWQANLWIGVAGTLPLMLGEWGWQLGAQTWFRWTAFALAAVVQFVAGAPFYRGAWRQFKSGGSNMDTLVSLGSTTAFGYSAWALLSGHGGHLYFMEVAAIITLISVGHWLEARVAARASSALRGLMQLAPDTARRIGGDGVERDVPVAELRSGDRLALRPGERIPTDAEVVGGQSAVDESMLTGESLPVEKSPGRALYAGTLNLNGRLVARVTGTGEATALARVIAAVERAQSSRANIQRLADRISNVFVPAVVTVALAAALWWAFAPAPARAVSAWLSQWLWASHLPEAGLAAAFICAAAVLIIACPCAMGLATPAAIMAGANAAARRGILIRDGVALEKAGKVTTVLLDKTGTLTAGKPVVREVWVREADGCSPPVRLAPAAELPALEPSTPPGSTGPPVPAGENPGVRIPDAYALGIRTGGVAGVLAVAAALARHSTHPLSQAVARLAPGSQTGERTAPSAAPGVSGHGADRHVRAPAPVLKDWREIQGSGVQATLVHDAVSTEDDDECSGAVETRVRLGALRWLEQMGTSPAAARDFIAQTSARGATLVGLAVDGKLTALFAIEDSLKPHAADVVTRLRSAGLKVFLVTGDNPQTAARVAAEAGIVATQVFAEVRPGEKAQIVKRLQAQGERVAFVGDGINDAPALEQADLGIAVSRASDIAREAADIILLKSDIEAVPESLGLARATLRTIRQNLFWAFFYNAVGVPLAALGLMSPVLCAAAMGASDLIVIANALRLNRWGVRGARAGRRSNLERLVRNF